MKRYILSLSLVLSVAVNAQYAPPAGQVGTTAIAKDSSAIVSWATEVISFNRGYEDIANPNGGLATFGDSTQALGSAEGTSSDVVSLGDGGSITLTFANPIKNGAGADFAVFENSFSETFLELAFVEVSTDGVTFVRFPSISLTPETEIGGFGNIDATKIHNLAGKYKQGYGTPFDLNDLVDSTGIDVNEINYVRLVDVVGTTNSLYATYDSQGHIVIDPYATPFASSGFDLDAIGVINEDSNAGLSDEEINVSVYPNPVTDVLYFKGQLVEQVELFNLRGEMVMSKRNASFINVSDLPNGIYIIKLFIDGEVETKKVCVNH